MTTCYICARIGKTWICSSAPICESCLSIWNIVPDKLKVSDNISLEEAFKEDNITEEIEIINPNLEFDL